MSRIGFTFRVGLCAALLSAVAVLAQPPATPAASPVPPALRAAKKIFVSNAGADSGLFPGPFTGNPDRGYNPFHAALQATGQYQMVSDPAEADLVLELQLMAPKGPTVPNKQFGASDPLPMFRLTIYDRMSQSVLWTLTESIDSALLEKTHERNFDDALNTILLDS